MSHLHFCGWRPVITRTLFGGMFLCGILAVGFSDDTNDKHTRHKTSEAPRAVERVARAERQSINNAPQVRQNTNGGSRGSANIKLPGSTQNVNGGNPASLKFQPEFKREYQRVPLQPNTVPTDRLPSNIGPSGTPSSVAFLQKHEKKTDNPKPPKPEPRNDPKPPKVEKPEVKINPEVKAKVELPRNPPVMKETNEGRITIRKTPTEKPNVQVPSSLPYNPNAKIRIRKSEDAADLGKVDPATGKIKIRSPQPDVKVTLPNEKNAAKNIGKTVDKNVVKNVDKPIRLKDGATLSRDVQTKMKVDLDKQHRDLVTKGKITMPERVKVKLPEQVKVAGTEKLQKLPREALKLPVPKNGKIDPRLAAKLNLKPAHEVLNTRLKNGDFRHLNNLPSAQKFNLHQQFQMHQHGDVGRRMNLLAGLQQRGGWRHRHFGLISPVYASHCMPMWYAGPSFCSPYLWYPGWSPWVDWCWWDTCAPIYDPRPIICHPIVYDPCSPWVYWEFPTWTPLPYVACGTWVDVEPVVISSGIDLQLLATRFVDPGHPDQELGPRFRVWVRNNTPYDVNQAFNVLLIASTDANAFAGLPEAGVRVLGLRAGETQAIDIRLPYAANTMGRDSAGRAIPFTYLTALVDSHNDLPEAFEANNGATLVRGDILPVDPSAFAAEPSYSQPGGIIHVAGEGFGPEPGQAMVVIGDQEFQAEILGWFDLGVQIRLPDFELDTATAADLVIIRGDGAASNPLTIEINPAPAVVEAVVPEGFGPELPDPPALPEPRS